MRCKHCGRNDSLVETMFRDEDGILYTDWLDLCVYCEEIAIERSEARREWNAYHDEPCPEVELPQFPTGASAPERT